MIPAWGTAAGSVLLPVRRAVTRSRGVLAALAAAAAVATALPLLAPEPVAGTPLLVAARDLPAGAVLGAADLREADYPRDAVPDGVLSAGTAVHGLRLAGAVRRGEPLTDARLLGPGLLTAAHPTLVATPVRLADRASALLLRPGDRVDVLAAAPDGSGAPLAAADVTVLAVPSGTDDLEGALVVLGTTRTTAARLAAAAVGSRLSVTVHRP